MGSIALNKDGGYYFYRSTKSFSNSIFKNLSIDLKEKNKCFLYTSGSVKTKLNPGGLMKPNFVAQKIINICAENQKNFRVLIDLEKKY